MKDRVNATGRRKIKLVGDLTNSFENAERAEKLEGQLLILTASNRSLNIRL